MKIATWNVNSLKVRLEHVCRWLEATQTDILCLQELKLAHELFPIDALQMIGYDAVWAGQKTYNGVAILYRKETVSNPRETVINIPTLDDIQQRLVATTLTTTTGDIRIISAYFPNGAEVGCDKYAYKLQWLEHLTMWLQGELNRYPQLMLLGDFNIAPDDRDVWNPKAWEGNILVSEPERAAFRRLLDLGLYDSFRLFDQPEGIFTWWDYRMLGFQKNHGVRIDHALVTDALKEKILATCIDKDPRKWVKPSDHTPYCVTLKA